LSLIHRRATLQTSPRPRVADHTTQPKKVQMIKIKLLVVGLVVTLAVTAMSAAPAGAWFKSRNQAKTTGLAHAGTTAFEAGGAKVSCESAAGEWSIQTKGQFKEHKQGEKQAKTTFGPHLYLKVLQWNGCKAEVALIKVAAKVSACEFQLEQPQKGVNTGTASVVSTCVITAPAPVSCTITVPPGNEQTGVNAFLKAIKGENSGQSVLATAEVEGIHGKSTCEAEEFTKAKFKSAAGGLVAEGLELA
jgi:hypothetical protein